MDVDGTRTDWRTPKATNDLETGQPDIERTKSREMAGWTGLEPAASAVTGQRSNQLNYHPLRGFQICGLHDLGLIELSPLFNRIPIINPFATP